MDAFALQNQINPHTLAALGGGDSPSPSGLSAAGASPSFSSLLKQAGALTADRRVSGADGLTTPKRAVEQGAEELVASAFFKPIFEMLRNDPLRSDFIPLSSGEKMFGPLLDAEFSKRITEKSNFSITDAIVRRLMPAANRQHHAAADTPSKGMDRHA